MRLAPNRKDIGDYFVSWGWLVLLFAVAAYAAWYWPITSLDAIRSSERINFFFEAYGLKENTLEESLLSGLKGNGVLEVNLYQYSPTDASLTDYYDAFGGQSDFLVLKEDDLDAMFGNSESASVLSQFVPFSPDLKNAVGAEGSYSFYAAGGEDYALKVHDKEDAAYNQAHPFDRLLSFSSDGEAADSFYLLLNASTPNFLPYDVDSSTANGILALSLFLSMYAQA